MKPDLSGSGAVISECGTFRYLLWRSTPNPRDEGRLGFIMLNPSTADAAADDPTIRKCVGFARRLGYGGILVANLFAFRATDPNDLKARKRDCLDAVGPDNNDALSFLAASCRTVVAAWGPKAWARDRIRDVRYRMRLAGVQLHAVAICKGGEPQHPLMAAYVDALVPWPEVDR